MESQLPHGGAIEGRAPIILTRRIQIKIQGSMSDFAQDGQGCATWRCMEGQEPVVWGLQVSSVIGYKVSSVWFDYFLTI